MRLKPVVAQAEALCHSRLFKLLKMTPVTFTVSALPFLDHLANSKLTSRFRSLLKEPRLLAARPGYLEGRSSSLLRY